MQRRTREKPVLDVNMQVGLIVIWIYLHIQDDVYIIVDYVVSSFKLRHVKLLMVGDGYKDTINYSAP